MSRRQQTFTAAQAAQMLGFIDEEYSKEYLNLPTPIEPLFHEDSSHSIPIAPAEPLFRHDSSSSHETPTLDIRRSWSNAGEDVEETDDVPKKRKRKSDPSTWKRNIIMQ